MDTPNTITKPMYVAKRNAIGYQESECINPMADIISGDKLQLLQCELNQDKPNAFRYMDALTVWIKDANDVEWVEDIKEKI